MANHDYPNRAAATMVSIPFFLTIILMANCTSLSENSTNHASPTQLRQEHSSKPDLCQPLDCPTTDKVGNYLCKVQIKANYHIKTAKSLCLAQQALQQELCRQGKADFVEWVACNPDPSDRQCPPEIKPCSFERQPMRCQAASYNGQTLHWSQQPSAWGANECSARQNLLTSACFQNLKPDRLSDIKCESAQPNAHCPPQYTCHKAATSLTVCSSKSLGKTQLNQEIKVIGKSHCDAIFKLQSISCRYPSLEPGGIYPTFQDIQCHPLHQEESQ